MIVSKASNLSSQIKNMAISANPAIWKLPEHIDFNCFNEFKIIQVAISLNAQGLVQVSEDIRTKISDSEYFHNSELSAYLKCLYDRIDRLITYEKGETMLFGEFADSWRFSIWFRDNSIFGMDVPDDLILMDVWNTTASGHLQLHTKISYLNQILNAPTFYNPSCLFSVIDAVPENDTFEVMLGLEYEKPDTLLKLGFVPFNSLSSQIETFIQNWAVI